MIHLKLKDITVLKIIQHDLNRIEASVKNFIINLSSDYEHFKALIITYRKCFSDNIVRHSKLENQRDLKGAD